MPFSGKGFLQGIAAAGPGLIKQHLDRELAREGLAIEEREVGVKEKGLTLTENEQKALDALRYAQAAHARAQIDQILAENQMRERHATRAESLSAWLTGQPQPAGAVATPAERSAPLLRKLAGQIGRPLSMGGARYTPPGTLPDTMKAFEVTGGAPGQMAGTTPRPGTPITTRPIIPSARGRLSVDPRTQTRMRVDPRTGDTTRVRTPLPPSPAPAPRSRPLIPSLQSISPSLRAERVGRLPTTPTLKGSTWRVSGPQTLGAAPPGVQARGGAGQQQLTGTFPSGRPGGLLGYSGPGDSLPQDFRRNLVMSELSGIEPFEGFNPYAYLQPFITQEKTGGRISFENALQQIHEGLVRMQGHHIDVAGGYGPTMEVPWRDASGLEGTAIGLQARALADPRFYSHPNSFAPAGSFIPPPDLTGTREQSERAIKEGSPQQGVVFGSPATEASPFPGFVQAPNGEWINVQGPQGEVMTESMAQGFSNEIMEKPGPEGAMSSFIVSKKPLGQAQRDMLVTLGGVLNFIQSQEALAKRLNDETSWGKAISQGAWQYLGAVLRSNPDARLYMARREAFAPELRKITGETGGRFTEIDVKSAQKIMPDLFELQETNDRAYAQLKQRIYTLVSDIIRGAPSISWQDPTSQGQQSPTNRDGFDPSSESVFQGFSRPGAPPPPQ